MHLSKSVKKALIVVSIIAALPITIWAIDSFTPSPVRQTLPASATEVKEQRYNSNTLQGDYQLCLQAKLPEAEMPAFAAKLGLNQRYTNRTQAEMPYTFATNPTPDWWQPPIQLNGTYFENKPGSSYTLAHYQNGRVYYLAEGY